MLYWNYLRNFLHQYRNLVTCQLCNLIVSNDDHPIEKHGERLFRHPAIPCLDGPMEDYCQWCYEKEWINSVTDYAHQIECYRISLGTDNIVCKKTPRCFHLLISPFFFFLVGIYQKSRAQFIYTDENQHLDILSSLANKCHKKRKIFGRV